jgi:hypothetical protein
MVERRSAKRNILTLVRVFIGLCDLLTDIIYFSTVDFTSKTLLVIAILIKIWFCAVILSYTYLRLFRSRWHRSFPISGSSLCIIIIFLPIIVPVLTLYGMIKYNWSNNGNDDDTEFVQSVNKIILPLGLVSESLPQLIIQGMNNSTNGDWTGFAIFSFFFSLAAVLADLTRVVYKHLESNRAKKHWICFVRTTILVIDLVTDIAYIATQKFRSDLVFAFLIVSLVLSAYVFTLIYCIKHIWPTRYKYVSIVIFLFAPVSYVFCFIWGLLKDRNSSNRSRVLLVLLEMVIETSPQLLLQGMNISWLGEWSFISTASFGTCAIAFISEFVLVFIECFRKNRNQAAPVSY